MVRSVIGRLLCRLGYHHWWPGWRYRYCQRCSRREVRADYGWIEHTYPPDADPTLDPTPCVSVEGDRSTVGFEVWWGRQCEEWYG
jgi:hypothetical protein